MIKFFRHLRKSLLMEHSATQRTSPALRYFKYAIGEILLVVIGILIALSINNWNTNRINNIREASYLVNLERDLNNQITAINTQMDFEAEVADYCKLALEPYNKSNKLIIDSTFAVAMGVITSRRTFLNPNPTYSELIFLRKY